MAFVTAAAACLVAAVLLLSAVHKLTRWQDYLKAVRSYKLTRRLHKQVRSVLAWVAPLAEAASAVLMFVPATLWRPWRPQSRSWRCSAIQLPGPRTARTGSWRE